MKVVAVENGFAFVFDANTDVLLYADPSLDVTKQVKSKLGIAE
jgi:Skp family chaperone for outer membrane proteins